MEGIWRRYNGDILDEDVVSEVEQTIISEIEAGHSLKICIGTDSQVNGSTTNFASVIVFVREREGGFMFIKKFKSFQKMSLKERMIFEVGESVQVAYSLYPIITQYKIPLEVHADINSDPHYKSNAAYTEAMGYIKGMGFSFKAKPHAFASSPSGTIAAKICIKSSLVRVPLPSLSRTLKR